MSDRKIKIENIEDEVINGGLAGTRRSLSILQSYIDGAANHSDGFMSKMSNEERKKLTEITSQANALFKTISSRTLNMISTNETYRNHIRDWKRSHGVTQNTKGSVAGLISHVESMMNKSIISSKRSDTRRKREIEKKIVMTFYKSNKDDIKKIFDLQNLFIQAKKIIDK